MNVPLCRLSAALCAIAAVPIAIAQEAAKNPEVARKAPFVFEAGTIELGELVERCGAYLGRNILLDDTELAPVIANRGRPRQAAQAPASEAPSVHFDVPVVADHDGCEELLSAVLWRHGLALVPLDEAKDVWEVLALRGNRQREITMHAVLRTPEAVLARPALRQFVLVVCKLDHTNAMAANNALRPFFAQSGGSQGVGDLVIGNFGNERALVLSGPQDLVANAIRLVQAADVPMPDIVPPEIEQRLDALAGENRTLRERVLALEKKVAKSGE